MSRLRLVIVSVLAILVSTVVFVSTREPRQVPATAEDAPAADAPTLEVGDHLVVARGPGAETFHMAFAWPVGFRDDPAVCHALHAWWNRTEARRDADLARGVELKDPRCGWTEVTLELSAPAAELSTVVPILLDDLERGPGPAPATGAAPVYEEQVQSFVTWAGITSRIRGDAVVQHALFGPRDRAVWFPPKRPELEAPDEAAIASSLRELARLPVDVAYAGPHDLATVTEALRHDRVPRSPPPALQLDDQRAEVYLWTDERMSIDLLITPGPYRAENEALYALFTHWTRSRVDAATSYLPRNDKAYGVITRFDPSLWTSHQNLLEIYVYKRQDRPLDVPHLLEVLRGVITSTSLTDDEWVTLMDQVHAEVTTPDPDGLTRARRVIDGIRRGLSSDPYDVVLQQWPSVTKADLEAFARQVASSPHTIVAGGVDGVTRSDFQTGTEIVEVMSK